MRQHVQKQTIRYIELPLDELEKRFDPQWLKDKVIPGSALIMISLVQYVQAKPWLRTMWCNQSDFAFWGQAGKPHPQDPTNPRKRIYKVFDKIEESASDQAATGFGLHGRSKVADNKAQRQALADALTTKAASTLKPLSLDGLFGAAAPSKKDTKTRNKKVPKELTPEEKQKKDFDADMKQSLGSIPGNM